MADKVLTDVDLEKRRQEAVRLRMSGATYERIAEQLGFDSVSTAYDDVKAGMKLTLSEGAAEARDLEMARLDAMLLAVWPAVSRGDVAAVDRALKVSVRRAKLLGLDIAPGAEDPEQVEDEVDRARKAREDRRRRAAGA